MPESFARQAVSAVIFYSLLRIKNNNKTGSYILIQLITRTLKQYLLFDQHHLKTTDNTVWKLSVIRLVLASGIILTLGIVVHSSYAAYTQKLYHVLILTFGFSALLWGSLTLSKEQISLATGLLTGTIILAAFCILFFTIDLVYARYGLLLFFTLPIFLRLFYGTKAAILGMLLNILPFILLLRNQPVAPLFDIDITLPHTHTYLSSLIFLFLNFCLPVAVMRVLASLEKQSLMNRQHSRNMSKLVKRYREIFNNGGTPSFFCDQHGKILQANKSGRKLLHGTPVSCEYLQQLFTLDKPMAPDKSEVTALRHLPDSRFRLQPASLIHHTKQLVHCFDISETATADKKLGQMRRHHFTRHYADALTALKNHHYWAQQYPHSAPPGCTVALLKVANLQDINLQYGFSAGDKFLLAVARQLQASLPSKVGIFRFPGAKFLLTVDNQTCPVENMSKWLTGYLPTTIDTGNPNLPQRTVHWRSGYCNAALFDVPARLIEACAMGLSQTSAGQPSRQYDRNIVKLLRQDSRNKDRVKQLLDTGSLQLWLQPQVTTEHTIIGFEVLARLYDAEAAVILQPYQFLPQVEKNQWHLLLTQQVLTATIEMIEHWPAAMPVVPLAVNLSGPELLNDIFYEKLLRHYSEKPQLRSRLKLELTETSVLASHEETKKRLTSLANVGVTIIIDDFGTGHASLSQLIDLSASVLKVDREFVERIESSERHRKIVKMTLELAHALGMDAIAEGVETEAQLARLTQMGFTLFQGYLFGKPAPLASWSHLVAEESGA